MKTQRTYRGWTLTDNWTARRGGTTIYGDSLSDVKRRIDAFERTAAR